jgi:glycerol-3-phosphate dehydrogenase (NAD(P)+)
MHWVLVLHMDWKYGDNFLSVLIANCADEMAGFLRRAGIANMEVGGS